MIARRQSPAVTVGASRRRGWLALSLALFAGAAAAITAVAVAAGAGLPGGSVAVAASGCGKPATSLPAGRVSFEVANDAVVFVTVYLIGRNGDVYAEIPSLPPQRSLPLATTLAAGTYALRCVFTNGTVRTSPAFTVTGTTTGAVSGFRPLPDLALTRPVAAYRQWVEAALPRLLTASRALERDVAAGRLAKARSDWLTAHLDYERLGVAYGSFGDFDDEINGMAKGLPQGTASPGWTGFFAIENGLWHGWRPDRMRSLTRTLVTSVTGLIKDFPSEEIDPQDLPLRAHEILENALQFQLTGIGDYGSGTTLATCYANTQGTREVLSVLAGLIRPRDPTLLAAIDTDLAHMQADLLAAQKPAGTWTPLRAVPARERQRIDGDLGELLEKLSVLPNLLYPRTSA